MVISFVREIKSGKLRLAATCLSHSECEARVLLKLTKAKDCDEIKSLDMSNPWKFMVG